MSQSDKGQRHQIQNNANLSAASLAGQLGCVIPALIIASVLGGVWLDRNFHTEHVFTILLLVASIPVSIYLTFKMAMRAVNTINQSIKPPASDQSKKTKEDETGE
jgi:magnesium-transporting ATPase (P-type)